MRVENAAERQLIVADEQLSSLEDIGRVLPTAQYLNVSFNSLRCLNGLEQMPELLSLDISYNEVESLQELASLRKLLVLKCSSNKIADLSWISGLGCLEELWLRDNRIERAQLAHLQQLTELQTLVIHPNPCAERSDYVLSILKVLPWLQRIDTVVITEELRVGARHAEERDTLDSGATDCSLFSLSGRSEESPSIFESPALASAPLQPSKSKQQIAAEDFMRSFPVQDFIPVDCNGASMTSENQLENNEGLSMIHPLEISSTTGTEESTLMAIKAEDEPIKMQKEELVTNSLSSVVKMGVKSGGTSALLNSVLMLPTFDDESFLKKKKKLLSQSLGHGKSKLRTKANLPAPSSLREGSETTQPFRQDEEYVVVYPNSTVTAIQVRQDGSAIAKWPAGNVAVSVDFETSPDRSGFRVYAAHKDGQLALSFDPAGVGFLNAYPSGKTLISTTSDGNGLLFDASSGTIQRQWDANGKIRDGSCQPVNALGDEIDGSLLCRLSEHLAVRVQLARPKQQDSDATTNSETNISPPPSIPIFLHIYFSAAPGIRHVFMNVSNRAEASSSDACDDALGRILFRNDISKVKAKPSPVEHLDLLSSIRAAVAGL